MQVCWGWLCPPFLITVVQVWHTWMPRHGRFWQRSHCATSLTPEWLKGSIVFMQPLDFCQYNLDISDVVLARLMYYAAAKVSLDLNIHDSTSGAATCSHVYQGSSWDFYTTIYIRFWFMSILWTLYMMVMPLLLSSLAGTVVNLKLMRVHKESLNQVQLYTLLFNWK